MAETTKADLESQSTVGNAQSKLCLSIHRRGKHLFTYNHSADEMKLLDVVLDATLDGKDYVQIDRSLYERMKSEKALKRQMDKEKECQK